MVRHMPTRTVYSVSNVKFGGDAVSRQVVSQFELVPGRTPLVIAVGPQHVRSAPCVDEAPVAGWSGGVCLVALISTGRRRRAVFCGEACHCDAIPLPGWLLDPYLPPVTLKFVGASGTKGGPSGSLTVMSAAAPGLLVSRFNPSDAERVLAWGDIAVGEVAVAGALCQGNYEPGAVGPAGGVAVDPFSGVLVAGS